VVLSIGSSILKEPGGYLRFLLLPKNFSIHCLIPVPFSRKYKQAPLKVIIKMQIMPRENDIDTSLTPNMPSLKVFTT